MNLLEYSEKYGLPPRNTIIKISKGYETQFPPIKKGTVLRIDTYEDRNYGLEGTCVRCIGESFSKYIHKFEIDSFMERHNRNLGG